MLLFLFIAIAFSSCKKDSYDDNDKSVFDDGGNVNGVNSVISQDYKLEIPYKRLEMFLGKKFIPIFSVKTNIDNDAEEEFVIAYKRDLNSKINLWIFDLSNEDVLRKRFELETEIFHNDSFLIQTQNLFKKNNTGIALEGKSIDNVYHLYIVSYMEDDYKIVGNFQGDFSILIDYEEVDDEKGKFTKIKNVIIISKMTDSVNLNAQKKETFIWNETNNEFELLNTEEFISTSKSSIDKSILYSEANYFNYIKGIWYPEKYKKFITENAINLKDFSDSSIKYIFITENPNEIGIKQGDYVDKYIIVKMVKLWNQRPGLRLILREFNNPNEIHYRKVIDLTLIDSNLLRVQGPERFDDENYVKLPKPFIEYVNEKKESYDKVDISDFEVFLFGNFKEKSGISLTFNEDKTFFVKQNDIVDRGIFQIKKDKDDFYILFFFDEKNQILQRKNFLIKVYKDKKFFTIIPVKFEFDKISAEELKSKDFFKDEN